jgi:hypothetical protein
MAIMVHFKDDTVSFIPDRELVELILTDSIVAFRRGAEWVRLAGSNIQNQPAKVSSSGKVRRGGPEKGIVWRRILVTDSA